MIAIEYCFDCGTMIDISELPEKAHVICEVCGTKCVVIEKWFDSEGILNTLQREDDFK